MTLFNQKNKFIVILFVVFILTILGGIGAFIYFKYLVPKSAASFVSAGADSFVTFNINPKSKQNQVLKELANKIGDEEFFSSLLLNMTFKETLKPEDLGNIDILSNIEAWIGEELAIANQIISKEEKLSVLLIKVKDKEKAADFIKFIEDKIKQEGGQTTEEVFRGVKIINLKGIRLLSYTFLENYLIISEKPDGIKQTIDVYQDRLSSLSEDSQYSKVKRNIDKNNTVFVIANASGILNIILNLNLPFAQGSLLNLVTKQVELLTSQPNTKEAKIGISLTPYSKGISAQIFFEKDSLDKNSFEVLNSELINYVPSDLFFFMEGNQPKKFIESLILSSAISSPNADNITKIKLAEELLKMGGLDLEKDVLEWINNPYGLVVLDDGQGKTTLGIILDIKDENLAKEKMAKIEDLLSKGSVADLIAEKVSELSLVKKEDLQEIIFLDSDYKNTPIRYTSVPSLEINYAIVNQKLLLTTSRQGIHRLIDSLLGRETNFLSKDDFFKATDSQFEDRKFNKLFYFNILNILSTLERRGHVKDLDSKYKSFKDFEFTSYQVEEGTLLKGFLLID